MKNDTKFGCMSNESGVQTPRNPWASGVESEGGALDVGFLVIPGETRHRNESQVRSTSYPALAEGASRIGLPKCRAE